jgi:hypothetical protein
MSFVLARENSLTWPLVEVVARAILRHRGCDDDPAFSYLSQIAKRGDSRTSRRVPAGLLSRISLLASKDFVGSTQGLREEQCDHTGGGSMSGEGQPDYVSDCSRGWLADGLYLRSMRRQLCAMNSRLVATIGLVHYRCDPNRLRPGDSRHSAQSAPHGSHTSHPRAIRENNRTCSPVGPHRTSTLPLCHERGKRKANLTALACAFTCARANFKIDIVASDS